MKTAIILLLTGMLSIAAYSQEIVLNQNEDMEKNKQEVLSYLKDCGVYFIATEEENQPRVRPFSSCEIVDGQLVILTGKVKDVYKQIAKNPCVELCAMNPSGMEWIRISATLVPVESKKAKDAFLELNPSAKRTYSSTDDNMILFALTNATARIKSFSSPERTIRF